jgi:exportin-2 (importin alpha re-exporter)
VSESISLPLSHSVNDISAKEHEVEQFEDDPLEYIRRDLSIEGGQTRRHASAELIRSLISVGLEVEVTTIVQNYVAAGLQVG